MLKLSNFHKLKVQAPKLSNDFQPVKKGDIVKVYTILTNNPVKKIGTVKMGLCPFHNERTPSFALYPSTSSYNCFGCSEGGDTITLIKKLKNVEFTEALEILKGI